MAGFYPDVTGQRFALDIDGTIFQKLDGAKTVLTDAQSASTIISDTDADTYQLDAVYSYPPTNTRGYFVLIFPELRNLDSYFIAVTGNYADPKELEYSSDTTDGLDGTWTQVTTNWVKNGTISPNYRTNITSQPLTNVKGLRFGYGSSNGGYNVNYQFNVQCMHLYGSIVGGQNPDRLRFWDAALDQEVGPAYFDFGDNSVGTNKVVQFRVKNNSSTKTASGVNLAKESASYTDVANGLTFSGDNTAYSTTLSIGDLAPGAISPVIYLKRSFDLAEVTSVPKDGRITATATTWS